MRLLWLLNTFSPGKEHIAEVASSFIQQTDTSRRSVGGHALLAGSVILQDSWVCEHRAEPVSTPGVLWRNSVNSSVPWEIIATVTLPSPKVLLGFHDWDSLVVMDGNNLHRHKRWLAQPHRKPTGTWEGAGKSQAVPRQPSLLVLSACLRASAGSISLMPRAPGSKCSPSSCNLCPL